MQHQLRRWRELMRGEIRVVKDTELTQQDKAGANLILWGNADSNTLIRQWIKKFAVAVPSGDQVLVGIYPKQLLNPAADAKLTGYVVFNSGLTFREGHDKTNSQQTPKLPDWAVIDISVPPSDTAPGKIVSAGFFDKDWKFVDPATQKKAMGY